MNAAVERLRHAASKRLSLNSLRPEAYELQEIERPSDQRAYESLLEETYEPLGFMRSEFKPDSRSLCYIVRYEGKVVAIFRLTPMVDEENPICAWIPAVDGYSGMPRLLEVNNVVIAAEFRSGILLGFLLYHCARISHANGFHRVIGITRHQVLRHFVEFGVVPVDHPPMRLLGRDHLMDFVIYYDTHTPESVIYMHERAKRYFHQAYVMRSIQEKYVRPTEDDQVVQVRAGSPAAAGRAQAARQ